MEKSKTDWDKLRAMKDSDIDTSDIPELDDEFFKNAETRPGSKNPNPPEAPVAE